MEEIMGFAFPLAVDPTTGRFKTTKTLAQDIRESIYILIMTAPGERILKEEYGCGISKYLFREINADMISRIEQEVYNNIIRWEPRVDNVTVEANADISQPERLLIDISYSIVQTGEPDELKVPLSMMEGVVERGK